MKKKFCCLWHSEQHGACDGENRGTNMNLASGLTRAELAVLLSRITVNPEHLEADRAYYASRCTFTDVPEWACSYVGFCVSRYLVSGYGNGLYGPNDAVTPAAACATLLRCIEGVGNDWTYDTACQKAVELGLAKLEMLTGNTITRDGIKELVFFNDMKPGIRLIKVDSANLSKPIANVKFRIEAVNGSFGPEEFTTDQNGEIDLSKLPTGAYVVTEIECPGYVIDQAQRIIQLDANETAQFVFTNSKRPTFTLVKLDSYDSSPLGGVTFRIAKIEDGTHYLDRVTDINGEIHIEDLDPGVYSVTEIDVPEGYVKNEGEWHVELFPGKDSTLVVTNDRKPDLTIRKTDKDTGEPVPGVTFTLNKVDGATITTEPTGADGTVTIHRLEPGVYTVTEQSVPEGYILDTASQMVTLFPNRNASVQFQNYKRPTLKIAKVDISAYQERCDYLIHSGSHSPAVMDRWVLKVKGLEKKKKHYEQVLRRELDGLDDEFTTLKFLAQELQVRANSIRLQKAA